MEDKKLSGLQAKLITRSKAKTSVGHRKIVNYLEKISKDESGAPVKWKFSKKGVKYAQGISKRIVTTKTDKKVKRLQGHPLKMEKPISKTDAKKPDKLNVVRKKPGRKKKTIEVAAEKESKIELNDDDAHDAIKTDNLIISIRRIDPESSTSGAMERIVTIQNPVENIYTPEKMSQVETKKELLPHTAPKRKRGKPAGLHKLAQENVEATKLKLSKNQTSEPELMKIDSNKAETLQNLEEVVAAKRGRPRKKAQEITMKIKKEDLEESTSREQSVSRFDSDIESIDSNISGSSSKQKVKIRKTYQGIRLGPRKLLRSQDSLVTRRKKVTLSSIAASKLKRKRTLSSDFELLDEVSLKRKIRKEEMEDVSRESSIDRDENRLKAQRKDEKCSSSKPKDNAEVKKGETIKLISTDKSNISYSKPKVTAVSPHDNKCLQNKANESGESLSKVKKRGRPSKEPSVLKEASELLSNSNFERGKMTSPKRKEAFHENTIPKLSKIKQKNPPKKLGNGDKKSSNIIEISSEGNTSSLTSNRSVFTFGTLKIIGPGGVKLKGNSPLKQVYDTPTESKTKTESKNKMSSEVKTKMFSESKTKMSSEVKTKMFSESKTKMSSESKTKMSSEMSSESKTTMSTSSSTETEGNDSSRMEKDSEASYPEIDTTEKGQDSFTATDENISEECRKDYKNQEINKVDMQSERKEASEDGPIKTSNVEIETSGTESEKESENQSEILKPTEQNLKEITEENLSSCEEEGVVLQLEITDVDENSTDDVENTHELSMNTNPDNQKLDSMDNVNADKNDSISSLVQEEAESTENNENDSNHSQLPGVSSQGTLESKETQETEEEVLGEDNAPNCSQNENVQKPSIEKSVSVEEDETDMKCVTDTEETSSNSEKLDSANQISSGTPIVDVVVDSSEVDATHTKQQTNEVTDESADTVPIVAGHSTDETTLDTETCKDVNDGVEKMEEESKIVLEEEVEKAELTADNVPPTEKDVTPEEKVIFEERKMESETMNRELEEKHTSFDQGANSNDDMSTEVPNKKENEDVTTQNVASASGEKLPTQEKLVEGDDTCCNKDREELSEAKGTTGISDDVVQPSLDPSSDPEIPGFYFRNIETKSTDEGNTEIKATHEGNVDHPGSKSEQSNVSEGGNQSTSINEQSIEKSEHSFEKDENSSSSELSLNQSGNFSNVRDEHLKTGEESSPEHGDHQSTKKKGKNVSPTQRVFQLRQKASRSPLEIIAMRQSKEEREYLLEQSQRAFKREEKQRKMKTKQQRLENTIEQGTANPEVKEATDTIDKLSTSIVSDAPTSEPSQNSDADKQESSLELEQQCKPCKVILIDFMKYLNVTEKTEMDSDDLASGKTLEQTDSENQNLDPSEEDKGEKNDGVTEEVQETTLPETTTETKKKRRPSARKQATGYHFNRKLTAEIVRSPEYEMANQSDSVVPPLRLKIKQNVILEPKKKPKVGRPPKRKARKSMSPKKKPNISSESTNYIPAGQTLLEEEGEKVDCPRVASPRSSEENDSDMCECIYNLCGFQSNRKNMETHIYVHLKNTNMTCLRCDRVFKNSSTAYAHSGKEHPSEEVLIEPTKKCDVKQFYKVLKSHPTVPKTPPQQIIPQVEQSPEAVIIKVVLPGNRHGKGCYCCSYCDFSSSFQQDILDHINENHRSDIQFTCSLCDKRFYGNKDGIAEHFKTEHPNDPIVYKSMPDFYDASKGVEHSHSLSSNDKGNIFEKFSDMFPREKSNTERSQKTSRTRCVEKTSAEADSTTAEHDDVHKESGKMSKSNEKTTTQIQETETEPEEDGIEALAKEYGQKTSADEVVAESKHSGEKSGGAESEESNDMGLKIVDVVSLRDQTDIDWSNTSQSLPPTQPVVQGIPYTNQSLLPTQPVVQGIPYGQIQNPNHQSLSQSNVSIVSALTSPRQYPNLYSSNIPPRAVSSPQLGLPQRNVAPPPPPSHQPRKKNDGKTCTTYKCEKCNVHAPVLATMVEHLRLSHKDIEKLFLCPYCRQYEGATEPDIHRHIKQFHQQTMQQKSPPVALSSAAKQHLRTIQVALGDNHSSNEKVVMEKDIYKCLKCNGHMPSLDFIYSHLEKQHNEFFVNACPECKRYRHKDEQVVFQHIRDVHGKSTENVTLSVAIEENLFTRVQCLTKGKVVPSKSQPMTSNISVPNVQMSRTATSPSQERGVIPIHPPHHPLVRPNIPLGGQIRPSFPTPASSASPLIPQQPPFPSKSSLRKSRPMHRDATRPFTQRSDAEIAESSLEENLNEPPPLMRAPPPLIRFQQTQFGKPINSPQEVPSSHSDAAVRGTSFGMTDRLQRLHSPNSSRISSPVLSTAESMPVVSRPVLKVPNIRSSLSALPTTQPPPYSVAISRGNTGSVLDLSRQIPTHHERSAKKTNVESDGISPDAFQIFNIRPGAPQNDPNMNNYNQFQIRPNSAPNPRLLVGMQSSPRLQALTQQMQAAKGIVPQRHYMPRQRFASPNVVVSDKNMPIEGRIFKCPYCPQIIPLNIGEVPRHIEQKHPGCTIVFHRI